MTGPRPGGVTLVAIFIWIGGALNVLGGVLALITQNTPGVEIAGGRGATITYAIISIILGIVIVAVSGGIMRGSRGARTIVTIAQAISIINAVFAIFVAPGQLWSSIGTIVLAAIPLVLLYSPKANAFFED